MSSFCESSFNHYKHLKFNLEELIIKCHSFQIKLCFCVCRARKESNRKNASNSSSADRCNICSCELNWSPFFCVTKERLILRDR